MTMESLDQFVLASCNHNQVAITVKS